MGKLILNGVEYSTSGNLYYPVIYSDTERKIGVWRDNKPLYQKTLIFQNAQRGRVDNLPHNISDVDFIFVESWEFKRSTSGIIGFENTNSSYWANLFQITSTAISYRIGESWGAGDLYVNVRYTKTTDTAGSGNWNTDGIPTHHYSTNEQVIGTWIDGKPLYEKTINYGTLPNVANVAKDVNHNIANVDKIWITEGFATNGTFVNQLNLSGVNNGEWYFGATSTYIRCVTQSDRSAYSAYVTIRYTKTTD